MINPNKRMLYLEFPTFDLLLPLNKTTIFVLYTSSRNTILISRPLMETPKNHVVSWLSFFL